MKNFFIFIFLVFFLLPAHSISSFSAKYDLYLNNNLGAIKVGRADYELVVTDNVYFFRINAMTDKLWSAIYDYSIKETSIGLIESNKFIGDYYEIIENQGDTTSDKYAINTFELIINDPLKGKLELGTNSSFIVDPLNLYLNISGDIQKSGSKVLTYNFINKKGLSQKEFTIIGLENIEINDIEIETIRIECSELDLVINVYKDYDFMPVFISKTNGKSNFSLILNDFKHL